MRSTPFLHHGRQKTFWDIQTLFTWCLKSPWKWKNSNAEQSLRYLKSMGPLAVDDLIENMRSIGHRYYELGENRLAETWWRRVVSCSLGVQGYQPYKVLDACLWVVDNLQNQGRISEAMNLHQGVHRKIMSLVAPEHEVAIFSMKILGKFVQQSRRQWIRDRRLPGASSNLPPSIWTETSLYFTRLVIARLGFELMWPGKWGGNDSMSSSGAPMWHLRLYGATYHNAKRAGSNDYTGTVLEWSAKIRGRRKGIAFCGRTIWKSVEH